MASIYLKTKKLFNAWKMQLKKRKKNYQVCLLLKLACHFLVWILSTSGDNELGGDDFDQKVIDHLVKEFKQENGIDLSKDKKVVQRLKDAAEKAKKELSSVSSTQISLPFSCLNTFNFWRQRTWWRRLRPKSYRPLSERIQTRKWHRFI